MSQTVEMFHTSGHVLCVCVHYLAVYGMLNIAILQIDFDARRIHRCGVRVRWVVRVHEV